MSATKTQLFMAIFALASLLPLHAENCPSEQVIAQLVRDYTYSWKPELKTNTENTEFRIRKLEVKGLWEELKLQVFDIQLLSRGTWFNGFAGLYYNGKITPLAPTFGGHGLMSGLMHDGEFYYTYSWGSGLHRSHVAKLQLVNGVLKHWASGGFQEADLFVCDSPTNDVHVISGEFKDFNKWERGKNVGIIRTNSPLELDVIGTNGQVVASDFYLRELGLIKN